jgi:hypothetical protein
MLTLYAGAGGVFARNQAEPRHELTEVVKRWKSPISATSVIAEISATC